MYSQWLFVTIIKVMCWHYTNNQSVLRIPIQLLIGGLAWSVHMHAWLTLESVKWKIMWLSFYRYPTISMDSCIDWLTLINCTSGCAHVSFCFFDWSDRWWTLCAWWVSCNVWIPESLCLSSHISLWCNLLHAMVKMCDICACIVLSHLNRQMSTLDGMDGYMCM